CPINKMQLLEVVNAYLNGRRPNVSPHSVCMECKSAGKVCVMVAKGTPCLGPMTHAGCGALCPGYQRGCYGCFGPKEEANAESLSGWFQDRFGMTDPEIVRTFRGFNAYAEPFRKESEAHDD
ncbi:MAG: oxidoreductase, partial [Candidatus Omnitrophica bacterium]|nr:oxidoreductase [Candidatus Omnitrophota bacterium]